MILPPNHFKIALSGDRPQIGLWLGWASAYTAEALAGTGFDWLLIDGEHAPNEVPSILAQLQAIAPYPVTPVVRPVANDAVLIKRLLDIGAQTLLVPMIDTPEQAECFVRAARYPPDGIRGVGAGMARASRWGQIDSYLKHADRDICLLVQVETATGLSNLDKIVAVEGVDGVFFGPADLSASMGREPGDPVVQQAILDAIARTRLAGKGAGILTTNEDFARRCLDSRANFVAVGVDTALLVRAASALAVRFKQT